MVYILSICVAYVLLWYNIFICSVHSLYVASIQTINNTTKNNYKQCMNLV